MSCRRHINRWLIVVSGFLQHRGRPTGMVRLWLDLHKHRDESTEILLLNWSDDPGEYAGLIWALAQDQDQLPTINVFGFSWGGQTAINLCRKLDKAGMPVDHLVLSDAVYRHWWLPRRWTSFVSWVALTVPANVRHVHWFRQRRVLPKGHDVIAEDSRRTTVYEPVTLGLAHTYMDDARDFHHKCHEVSARGAA